MADTPDTADLRPYLWGVEHTGQVPAAAASAAATALEYHLNRLDQPALNLSTMFIHYNARIVAGKEGQNVGTSIDEALKAVETYGSCRDELWPSDANKVHTKPPQEAYNDAKRFAKLQFYSPADVYDAISKKYPVVASLSLPRRCLDVAGTTGLLPPLTAEELQAKDKFFHHAMVLVAFDKRARTFVARNCWGTAWGDNGHCTIPVDVLQAISPLGSMRYKIIAMPAASAKGVEPAEAAAPAAEPEKMSDIAARLKADIRADLKKDLEEAQKRVRDMLKKPGGQ